MPSARPASKAPTIHRKNAREASAGRRIHAGRGVGGAGGGGDRTGCAHGRGVGTARTSGYLRDKTLAQWIALNRLAEVRLTVNKVAQSSSSSNGDTGELQFASRTWHYDTRYYDTQFQSTKRIVVRVWAGDAKTKGNPVAEATGFYGSGLSIPGNSNASDWTQEIPPRRRTAHRRALHRAGAV